MKYKVRIGYKKYKTFNTKEEAKHFMEDENKKQIKNNEYENINCKEGLK